MSYTRGDFYFWAGVCASHKDLSVSFADPELQLCLACGVSRKVDPSLDYVCACLGVEAWT